jgi:hypothetical protein
MKNLLIPLILLLVSSLLFAQIPDKISYQGLLSTPAGTPVQDGSYDLQFDIFNLPSGGSLKHTETLSGVLVQKGTFSVILHPPYTIFSESLFVEITALLGPATGLPVTFSPRSELVSSPYALAPWTSNGSNIYFNGGSVGIGTMSPSQKLEIAGNMRLGPTGESNTDYFIRTGGQLSIVAADEDLDGTYVGLSLSAGNATSGYGLVTLHTAGSERVRVDRTGNVGIGTTIPYNKLSVKGNADFDGNVGVGTNVPDAKFEVSGSNNEAIRASYNFIDYRYIQMRYHTSVGPLIEGVGYPRLTLDADNTAGVGKIVLGQGNDNVGIGTVDPGNKLSILGDADISGRVGIGTTIPNTSLDLSGSLSLRRNPNPVAWNPGGINNSVNFGEYSFVQIIGGGGTLTGIANGTDGKVIIIYCGAGGMTIANNNAGSPFQDQIRTMSGVNINIVGEGSVTLIYSTAMNNWIVTAFMP